jgi:hypothetical protein
MKPIELFRLAVTEMGDVSAAELSAHLEKHHGISIEPAFIPLFKASLQELEKTTRLRQDAKANPPKQPDPVMDSQGVTFE